MPDVLLAGAFGQRNPGDEALLRSFLRALPRGRVVVASSDPAATTTAHACEAIPSSHPHVVLRELKRVDALVIGGGTVFKTLHPSSRRRPHALLRNATLLVAAARALGRPVLLTGVGVGSLATRRSQRLSRRLVRAADLLVLRDEESAAVLTGIGAPAPFRVGADPAWTLLDEPPAEARARAAVAVVALSHLAGDMHLAGAVVERLRPVADTGLALRLQPWQHTGDPDLARAVAARLDGDVSVLDPPADLAAARAVFATAQLVIGMRFHALVAAAAAGTPFVAVDHELKLGAIARRFSQPSVALTEPPTRLATAVADALAGAPPGVSAVREQIARAEEGFRLMRLVLEGGAGPDSDELTGLPLEPAPWKVPA
ncbi:MAG: polysaccharide pyruvyl transferase family protein [Acidimicrobiia bacterium]